jgi:hypothetical protein
VIGKSEVPIKECLHFATTHRHMHTIKFLVGVGADLKTCFDTACFYGFLEIVKFAEDQGHRDLEKGFLEAVKCRQLHVVAWLASRVTCLDRALRQAGSAMFLLACRETAPTRCDCIKHSNESDLKNEWNDTRSTPVETIDLLIQLGAKYNGYPTSNNPVVVDYIHKLMAEGVISQGELY